MRRKIILAVGMLLTVGLAISLFKGASQLTQSNDDKYIPKPVTPPDAHVGVSDAKPHFMYQNVARKKDHEPIRDQETEVMITITSETSMNVGTFYAMKQYAIRTNAFGLYTIDLGELIWVHDPGPRMFIHTEIAYGEYSVGQIQINPNQ